MTAFSTPIPGAEHTDLHGFDCAADRERTVLERFIARLTPCRAVATRSDKR